MRRDIILTGIISILSGVIGLSIAWSYLSLFEGSLGTIIRGLGGESVERLYTLFNVLRGLSILTVIFGCFVVGIVLAGKISKIRKRSVISGLVISVLLLTSSFLLQNYEERIEHVETKSASFPTTRFYTESLRLQIPEGKYGVFTYKPSKILDQNTVEEAVSQVENMLPQDAEVINVDKGVECQVSIWLRRTAIFIWGNPPPFNVKIETSSFSKEFNDK